MANQPHQILYREIGPGDNQHIWGKLLPKNALFTNFCLASINYDIFVRELSDLRVFPYAYVFIKFKSGNNRTPRHDIDTAIIGEFMAPHIPYGDLKFMEPDARNFFTNVMKRSVGMEEAQLLHQALPGIGTEEETVAHIQSNDMTFEQAYRILVFLGNRYAAVDGNVGIRVLLGMVTGFLKRGSISDDYRTKMADALRNEMSINVSPDVEYVAKVYATYGQYITSDVARATVLRWRNFISPSAIKLRTMCEQASWDGLTTYIQIREAFIKYKSFYWLYLANLDPYGAEMAKFHVAVNMIDDDQYYGFNPVLGDAASTKYKSLGYVCIQLHIVIGGNGSLRRYAGKGSTIPHKGKIDMMINHYRDRLSSVLPDQGPVSDAQVHDINRIIRAVCNLDPEEEPYVPSAVEFVGFDD